MIDRTSSTKRGYGYRWQRARAGYLRIHPLCVACEKQGRTEHATVVDHIKPHKGNVYLFWDSNNWQALCKRCHDSDKQRQERSGAVIGCDTNGMPIDAGHHWHGGEGG